MKIQCGIDDTALNECTTTDLNTTHCPHVAGVNCGGKIYCTLYEGFFYNIIHLILAFCLTFGYTDCNECTSPADCGVTSNGVPLCECYSDCYEYGDCCSDISHVKNCVGEWFYILLCMGYCYSITIYLQLKNVKLVIYVWWVE